MSTNYLTPDEVAYRLKVSPKSVRKWLRTQRLRGRKIGRLWRIPEEELALSGVSCASTEAKPPANEGAPSRISAYGRYAHLSGSVDEFLREKHEETQREERKREETFPR